MYQNLSATSEAEIAFRQAIDNVGDAEQREQLRQAYIQVETQARTHDQYSFARHSASYFLLTAIELGQTALVKFSFAWFSRPPQIIGWVIVNGNLELLKWLLPKGSPPKGDNQCWPTRDGLMMTFYGMICVAVEHAQLTVIQYFCETYKQEWQKCYTRSGDDWLLKTAKRKQLEMVRFLLTRDEAEQVISNMEFWVDFNPRAEVKSKVFAGIIETIIRACAEIRSEKLFALFIGKVQGYIALQPQEEQLGLQVLVKRAIAIERSKLQHQRAGMVNTFAGLVDAVSETLEDEIATYNPVKK